MALPGFHHLVWIDFDPMIHKARLKLPRSAVSNRFASSGDFGRPSRPKLSRKNPTVGSDLVAMAQNHLVHLLEHSPSAWLFGSCAPFLFCAHTVSGSKAQRLKRSCSSSLSKWRPIRTTWAHRDGCSRSEKSTNVPPCLCTKRFPVIG